MNRVFHARIAWYQYFLIVVLGVNASGFLWCKYIVPALFFMLLLIIIIEQVIHTLYTMSADGVLTLSYGRFIRKKVVLVSDITSVKVCRSMQFGRFSVTHYVLIEYGNGKFASALPVKETEFMRLIEEKRQEYNL